MKREAVRAGAAGLSLMFGLARGKTLEQAREETREIMTHADPILDALQPAIDRVAAKRARKAAAASAARGECSAPGCVLPAGHTSKIDGWHKDVSGTLFQHTEGAEPC